MLFHRHTNILRARARGFDIFCPRTYVTKVGHKLSRPTGVLQGGVVDAKLSCSSPGGVNFQGERRGSLLTAHRVPHQQRLFGGNCPLSRQRRVRAPNRVRTQQRRQTQQAKTRYVCGLKQVCSGFCRFDRHHERQAFRHLRLAHME